LAECVILIGLPGAGKTTFFRGYFAASHRLVSKDLWPEQRSREQRQAQLIREALRAGDGVVVDNTNPTRAERARLIAIAHAESARVVGYFFDVTTRQAVARNAGRAGSDKVPNVAIFSTAKRLERPSIEEGFDQLFSVTITPERTFAVRELIT
jgi:predicted kinase